MLDTNAITRKDSTVGGKWGEHVKNIFNIRVNEKHWIIK